MATTATPVILPSMSFIGPAALKRTLQLFCVDLSGTIHIGPNIIPGANEALEILADRKLKVKFVTNTTKESKGILVSRLSSLGLNIPPVDIHSSLSVTRDYIIKKDLKPLFLVDDNAMQEFADLNVEDPRDVVVGLAPNKFYYDKMNEAFRVLMKNGTQGKIVATHKGRYYRDTDGEISLGPGPFVQALEYATGRKAVVLGKPNQLFFDSVMNSCSCRPRTTIMIGDDVNDDVIGALQAGMNACLVRTGKYRVGDENTLFTPPGETAPVPVYQRALVADTFLDAVRMLT